MSEDQDRSRREHHFRGVRSRDDRDDEPRSKAIKLEHDDQPSTSRRKEQRGSAGSGGSVERRPDRDHDHDRSLDNSRSASSVSRRAGNSAAGTVSDSGCGAGSEGCPKRDRMAVYDLVCSRPTDLISKKGTSGQPIKLQTNYYKLLKTPLWSINQYHVEFEPAIEMRRLRSGLLSEHRSLFGGYVYDGLKLFCSNRLEQDITVLHVKSRTEEFFKVTLKFVGSIAMTESQSLQVLNLILRRAMSGLKLQLVGRNFYDAQAKIDLREFRIQLWPGYETSIRQHELGLMLCAEIAHKVMRSETMYDILRNCMQTSREYKEDFRRQVLGMTVLTDYNNKTYIINDVDFSLKPRDTFSCKKKDTSFLDYYYEKYRIRIRDQNQPMLISKAKGKTIRGGGSDIIILIPELCRATGLTNAMRTNFQLMRAMSDHTRMNPDRRIERLGVFNQRLQSTPDSVAILNDWNMTLDRTLVEVNGRHVDQQKIIFKDARKILAGEQADWTREFRNNQMFIVPSNGLRNWTVIGTNRSSGDLRNFCQNLIHAAEGLGMRMSRPKEVLLYDDRNHTFMTAMDDCAREDPQLILCLMPKNNAEIYALIKRKGCLERGIPTQVITQKTVGHSRGLMSIATKVAIQINCKLGYTPWIVNIPCKGLMTIGYDVAKSTRDKSKAYGALVATMDMQVNATFYSTVAECNTHDVLANHLWPMMAKALRQYMKEHKALPARILFYRDGVGEGSLQQVYEHEVSDIVEKLTAEYSRVGLGKPLLAYIVVTKNINTRLFCRGRNPPPGTIVDDAVTLPERFDFFLVSQSVRQGTVSPTSYNVLFSTINLTPDQIQLLTYKMTHLYYNWSGTTRVPAVCQYAKKLATLVATCLYQPPVISLQKKLFYL